MQTIQLFKTDDGQTFTNIMDARQHEVDLETMVSLKSVLADSILTGRVDSVLLQVLCEAEEVKQILIRHKKRSPKLIQRIRIKAAA